MHTVTHSIRLAVNFLLVALFSLSILSQTAYAATPQLDNSPLFKNNLASNNIICSYNKLQKQEYIFNTINSLKNDTLMPYKPQVIALEKDSTTLFTATNEATQVTTSGINTSPTATPTVAPAQEVLSGEVQAGLNADLLFDLVNQHRVSIGLAPFERNAQVCDIALSRAPELNGEIYGGAGMHAGFRARILPFDANENMISQQTEVAALNWWLNSSVHRGAIEGNYKYACIGCSGNSCSMIFSNLSPK